MVCLVFVATGYGLSDDLFFERLVAVNHIASPEDAFRFVRAHTSYPPDNLHILIGSSPRYMLTRQRYLYCDQSSIVMATIVSQLGYETTLINLVGDDGESHHTVLGVWQDESWKVYDLMNGLQGRPLRESAKDRATGAYYRAQPDYRAYPRLYHWIVQHNFYLMQMALWLRGLPG